MVKYLKIWISDDRLLSLQSEIITETLDYESIDLLSDLGGYLGLFIGASILSLYEVSIYYLLRFITRIKSRFGSSSRIEDLKTGYNGEGPDGVIKINDSTFQLKKNITSKPSRVSNSENENTKLLINIQEELARQGDVLAKHDIIISNYPKKFRKWRYSNIILFFETLNCQDPLSLMHLLYL